MAFQNWVREADGALGEELVPLAYGVTHSICEACAASVVEQLKRPS